jgi:hypothetical protein
MKKLFMVGVLGLALSITGVFAQHPGGLGIGIQGGFGLGGGGPALSLKVPSLPIYWAVRLTFKGSSKEGEHSQFGIGVSGDYYFYDQALLPEIGLGWYLGGGAFVGYYGDTWHYSGGDKSWATLQIGGELPVGLSWMIPIPVKLELYLQAVPNIGVQIKVADDDYYDGDFFWFDIGANLGIRIWL